MLLCTDGSEAADHALRAGLALLAPADRVVVLTTVEEPAVVLPYDASGLAGAAMSAQQITDLQDELVKAGQEVVDRVATGLGLESAERKVVIGDPARAIVDHANEIGATVIVMGSRGHGGFRRAVLGSVSDHVIRHAPCPVLVTGHDA